MKFTAIFAAIMSVALISADCSAQSPGRQRGGKGANAGAERGAQGQRGERGGQGRGMQGRVGGQERDPAALAARMMKEFDKDGDNKLNTAELVALMTSFRDRRGSGPGGNGPGGNGQGAKGAGADGAERRMGKGQRPEGAGKGKKGKGKGDGQTDAPGGQSPKRPQSDLS
ncbi:MAG: EF-hand domain-containing protein [Fuerstiella sp.]